MKKLNRTQRARRTQGFSFVRALRKDRKSVHASPWKGAFPIEEPKPIVQKHPTGNRIAMTVAPTRNEEGKLIPQVVPVCLHRCTHINMRHTVFDAPRPRDARRAKFAAA